MIKGKNMLAIKQLKDSKSIDDACALLYQILIGQDPWHFSADNPSQLSVKPKHNRYLLVDRFTYNAVWFGAFDNDQLVGCLRATLPDENNKLEIEGYSPSQIIQIYLPRDRSTCVELTRLAILDSHRHQGVARLLFLAMFKHCQANRYSVCGASSNNFVIALFKKIEFSLKIEQAFKYEPHDSAAVNFYFADYHRDELKNIVKKLDPHRLPPPRQELPFLYA